MMTKTKEELFRPGKMSAQNKASATDQAARQIVATEAAQRARKTERLRKLREAQEAATAPAFADRRAKPAKPGRM